MGALEPCVWRCVRSSVSVHVCTHALPWEARHRPGEPASQGTGWMRADPLPRVGARFPRVTVLSRGPLAETWPLPPSPGRRDIAGPGQWKMVGCTLAGSGDGAGGARLRPGLSRASPAPPGGKGLCEGSQHPLPVPASWLPHADGQLEWRGCWVLCRAAFWPWPWSSLGPILHVAQPVVGSAARGSPVVCKCSLCLATFNRARRGPFLLKPPDWPQTKCRKPWTSVSPLLRQVFSSIYFFSKKIIPDPIFPYVPSWQGPPPAPSPGFWTPGWATSPKRQTGPSSTPGAAPVPGGQSGALS